GWGRSQQTSRPPRPARRTIPRTMRTRGYRRQRRAWWYAWAACLERPSWQTSTTLVRCVRLFTPARGSAVLRTSAHSLDRHRLLDVVLVDLVEQRLVTDPQQARGLRLVAVRRPQRRDDRVPLRFGDRFA